MKKLTVHEYLKGTIKYDGGYILSHTEDDWTMVMDIRIRGWGKIQHLFDTHAEAAGFQDSIGSFIAEAIREKLSKERDEKVNEIG